MVSPGVPIPNRSLDVIRMIPGGCLTSLPYPFAVLSNAWVENFLYRTGMQLYEAIDVKMTDVRVSLYAHPVLP
jgi:hypothetical protein